MQPLQAQVSVSQLRDDPDFNAMAPEIQVQYLSEEFLPKADPTFNQLPANLRSQYIQEEVMPQIRPVDVKGVGDTGFGQGLGNVANAFGQWVSSVPGQIGQAFNTEIQNTAKNPFGSAVDRYLSVAPMAVEGVRDLFQMPADLLAAGQNAFTQTNDFKPLYNLPSTRDLPVVGGWIGEQMDKYPVFNFAAGNAIPVEAGLGVLGKAIKGSGVSKAAKASKTLPRVKAPNAFYGDFGPAVGVRSQGKFMPQGQVINRNTQRFIQDTQKFQGIDPKNTAQVQAKAYKKAFEQLEQAARNSKSPTLTARIKQAQQQLQQQYKTAQPAKAAKAQKISLVPDSEDFKALVEYTRQLRQAGRVKEADMALGQFDNATRAKAYDQVKIQEAQAKQQRLEASKQARLKAQAEKKQYEADFKKLVEEEKASQLRQKELKANAEKIQNLKDRQTSNDLLALEKAESKNRQRELRQLKGQIQERAIEQKAQAKQQDGAKQQNPQGAKPDQQTPKPGQGKNKTLAGPRVASRQAIKDEAAIAAKSGELVEFNYSAEGGRSRINEERIVSEGKARDGRTEAIKKGGESLDKKFGYRKEVVIETGITKAGDDFMRTMDADGNISTRIISGKGQKSKVNWLRRTGEQPPDGFGANTGTRAAETAYSSELKASINKMSSVVERVKRGEAVTNQEIMDAARPMSEPDFIKNGENFDRDKINKLGRKVDC